MPTTEGASTNQTNRRGRRASVARVGGVVGSLALVSWLVVTGSGAVFNASTNSSANSFTVGDVNLVDDDLGSAMFSVTSMEPGQTVSHCIRVTYNGSIPDPSKVVVYSGGYVDSAAVALETPDMASKLNLTITEGTGGTFADCTAFVADGAPIVTGTLAAFNATSFNYGNGAGTWDPAATPASKTYKVTAQLDPSAPNSLQNDSVTGLTFTWEIQN